MQRRSHAPSQRLHSNIVSQVDKQRHDDFEWNDDLDENQVAIYIFIVIFFLLTVFSGL